jgi:hypothetical protein
MPIQREPRRAVHDHVYRAGVAIIPNLSSTSASSNGVQGDTGRRGLTVPMDKLGHVVADHLEWRLLDPQRLAPRMNQVREESA